MGQSPLSPIDLHLQLFLRESAYLSYSSSRCSVFPRRYVVPCVAPSHSQFYFFFRPQRYLHPRFHESLPGFSGYREFAVHFIITLDGNKLSKRCACACNPGVRTSSLLVFVYINRANMLNRDKNNNKISRKLKI